MVKNPPANAETGVQSLIKKIPWRRTWQPSPVLLPGKPHGQRNLAGYSPWGCKRVGHNLATKYTQTHQWLRLHASTAELWPKKGGFVFGKSKERLKQNKVAIKEL